MIPATLHAAARRCPLLLLPLLLLVGVAGQDAAIASFVLAPDSAELACPSREGDAEVSCYRVDIKVTTTDSLAGFQMGLAGTPIYTAPVCTLTPAQPDADPAVDGSCSAGCTYVAPIAEIVEVVEVVEVVEACTATTGLGTEHCSLTAADPDADPPVVGACIKVAAGAPECRYVAPVAPVAAVAGVPATVEACINSAVDTKIGLANEVFPNYAVSIHRHLDTCTDSNAGTESANPAVEKEACKAVVSAAGDSGAYVQTDETEKHIATLFVGDPSDLQVRSYRDALASSSALLDPLPAASLPFIGVARWPTRTCRSIEIGVALALSYHLPARSPIYLY
jgi:hypothetical protein